MNEPDPRDWLTRLSASQWIAAADNELDQCESALARRAYRPGITHARRAAGMALNAVLRERTDLDWGRSYMDHLTAVATDEGMPAVVREAAQALTTTRPVQPSLVQIGRPDTSGARAARVILDWARRAPQIASQSDVN